MVSKIDKKAMRLKRHVRVRAKISGTPERPRLNVFRSNANIYAQIIDDVNGVTLVSANTLEKDFEGSTGNAEAAKKVGAVLAERAKAKGIEQVVVKVKFFEQHSVFVFVFLSACKNTKKTAGKCFVNTFFFTNFAIPNFKIC